jgi:hypothetical protein
MNNTGYQLIEPNSISSLNLLGDRYEVAMLHWIVSILRLDFSKKNILIKIDVIVANYQGSYPCIGIHYSDESIPSIESEIESKINEIIDKGSISDFLNFIIENRPLIDQTIKKL